MITLLGPVPRLDSWLDQFYRERSKLVHEGKPHRLTFLAADRQHVKEVQKGKVAATTHGMLIDYGLRVFRLCLNATLAGSVLAAEPGLGSLFVSDLERLDRIAATLSRKVPASPMDRLAAAATDLFQLGGAERPRGVDPGFQIPLDKLWSICRLLLTTAAQAFSDLPGELNASLAEAIAHGRDESVVQHERLEALSRLIRAEADRRRGRKQTCWTVLLGT